MRGPGHSYAPQVSIGPYRSESFHQNLNYCSETCCRIKEKLQSGETLVRGDQWPLFLYADVAYDPQDPWNGLLRSELLVAVRISPIYSVSFLTLDEGIQTRLHLPELC
jgi:hypothetical protein